MSIFKKSNLQETFKALNERQNELCAAMSWFDGSDGELEVIEEAKFISAVFETYYDINGVSARQYFNLPI